MDLCIQKTETISNYSNFYNLNDINYKHKKEMLNFMLLVLIRKHCTWTVQSVIDEEQRKARNKRKDNTSAKGNKRLNILKQ